MSGLEVGGIVLGVLPIVIKALSSYQEGKGVWALMKYHGLIEQLVRQIESHKLFFYLDLLELLRQAKVPGVLNSDGGDPPEEQLLGILQDAETDAYVREYLGHLYEHFLKILGYYEEYLKRIASTLETIVRLRDAPRDDLSKIVEATRTPGNSTVRGRLKFAINKTDLADLVRDLGTERYSIGKLLKRAKTRRESEATRPTSGAATLAVAFFSIGEIAAGLYEASCHCWQCDCHCHDDQRKLMVRLDHRIHSKPPSGRSTQPAYITFGLYLSIEKTVLQEINITARPEEQLNVSRKTTVTWTTKTERSLQVPGIIVTASEETNPATVLSKGETNGLCYHAREARNAGRPLTLDLRCKILELRTTEDHGSHQCYTASTTLADFLHDTAQDEDARLSPIQQTHLALSVACSVLQLRQTTWYSTPWNASSIVFPSRMTGDSGVAVCTPIPYVEQVVDDNLARTCSYPVALDTKAAKNTMLELAIMLLEILHHKPIEKWAESHAEGATVTYWDRMRVATCWMERSQEKLLAPHLQPIEHCLQRCAQSRLDWDADFRKTYCENIIKPLQELVL